MLSPMISLFTRLRTGENKDSICAGTYKMLASDLAVSQKWGRREQGLQGLSTKLGHTFCNGGSWSWFSEWRTEIHTLLYILVHVASCLNTFKARGKRPSG